MINLRDAGKMPGLRWVNPLMMNPRIGGLDLLALVLAISAALTPLRAFAAETRLSADKLAHRLQIMPRDGSLSYGESDIEMNATGFALSLRRCYRSSNTAEGVFGRGWSCVLDRRIEASQRSRVTLRNEWGETVVFAPRGSSLLHSQSGRPQWLLIEEDGMLLRDWRGQFWSFDKGGGLHGIYNTAMAGVEIEYENGHVARLCDPYERSIRLKTDGDGRIIEARSSAGHFRRYEYAQGRLVRVLDSEGLRAEYSYDSQKRLTAIVVAGTERAEITYDSQGRLTRLGGPSVAERTVRYQQRTVPFPASVVQVADAFGHAVQYRFREQPRECQIALPGGATATIDYDKRQLPTRLDLPQERRIELEYDDSGNLTRLTLPGGADYVFGYTGRGDLKQWTRADGATFLFERSETGQLRHVSGPRPEIVRRFSFNSQGRLDWLADGMGRALVFTNNTRGDLSFIAVQGGTPSLLLDHDESGWLSRIAPPGRPALSVIYGASGRPEALTDSLGYRLAFVRDRLGRLAGIEDCEDHREHFERDSWGRPSLWRRPNGGETRLGFDREGNLAEIRPPEGNTCRLAYDERNLATSETWLGSQRRLQWDEFGCVVARRNGRDQTIRLLYDPMGRPSDLVRETRDVSRFQYARDGRVLRITGRDAEYRFGNDTMGRPTRVAESRGNVWVEYVYDAKGRVAALALSGGRRTYEYDAQGRLARMVLEGKKATDVQYVYENDRTRLPGRALLPGGTNMAYEYDSYGRIISLHATLRSGKTALAERYGYDGRGNVVHVESTGRRVDLEYDSQNRLVAQQLNGHVYARLQYGRDGRLLKIEGEEGNLEFVYDGDGKPTRSSQARFEYDRDGNRSGQTTLDGTTRYQFDSVGRLASVALPSGATILYTYSANGWPIGRSFRGQTVGFFFLGNLRLFGTRRTDNTAGWFIADPLWGLPLGLREGPRTDLAYRDALGRLKASGEAGGDSLKTAAWGLFGRRPAPDRITFYDPVGLDDLGFDGEANLSGTGDLATGLSLVPRSLSETLSPYSSSPNRARGTGILPVNPRGDHCETALLGEIAAACAAGQFAPEEGTVLRYLLASASSPGWPDVGSDETFDRVLDGGSFRTPSTIAREIIETVLRDGTGGLPACAFAPHVGLPQSWLGLGCFRTICPTLNILPPVILEKDMVGDTVWSDNPSFVGTDNELHSSMGQLIADAADRCEVRLADDGCLRLLGELLKLCSWTMYIPDRGKDENLPAPPEPTQPTAALAERLARRDRLLKSLDQTP